MPRRPRGYCSRSAAPCFAALRTSFPTSFRRAGMYYVTVCLHDQTSLYNASKALAGLYGLAERGEATVRLTSCGFADPQPAVLQLVVHSDQQPEPRRIVI